MTDEVTIAAVTVATVTVEAEEPPDFRDGPVPDDDAPETGEKE